LVGEFGISTGRECGGSQGASPRATR